MDNQNKSAELKTRRITLDELAQHGKEGDAVIIEFLGGGFEVGVLNAISKDKRAIYLHNRHIPEGHPDTNDLRYHCVGWDYERGNDGVWTESCSVPTRATHCYQIENPERRG